jgi:hypothetical protein
MGPVTRDAPAGAAAVIRTTITAGISKICLTPRPRSYVAASIMCPSPISERRRRPSRDLTTAIATRALRKQSRRDSIPLNTYRQEPVRTKSWNTQTLKLRSFGPRTCARIPTSRTSPPSSPNHLAPRRRADAPGRADCYPLPRSVSTRSATVTVRSNLRSWVSTSLPTSDLQLPVLEHLSQHVAHIPRTGQPLQPRVGIAECGGHEQVPPPNAYQEGDRDRRHGNRQQPRDDVHRHRAGNRDQSDHNARALVAATAAMATIRWLLLIASGVGLRRIAPRASS